MRILFVHNHLTRFVQIDRDLLRERFDLREWNQRSRLVNIPALARAIAPSDLVVGWFASWHTFFPILISRALGKPSLLVVGGYDTANLPEIGYGSQRGGFKQWISRVTMTYADRLVVNSRFAREEATRNARADSEKVEIIHHGLESEPVRAGVKRNSVITVGNVDRYNLQRKGLEPFVRSAELLPTSDFILIGAWRDGAIQRLRALASPNVQFTGWVKDDELRNYFSRATVYVQASRHEGFGLAVAEAMLHECVPVVTRAGSLPEVVGDVGVYIESPEPREIAKGVRRAFANAATLGPRARERVLREFPLEKRRQALYALIEDVLKQKA